MPWASFTTLFMILSGFGICAGYLSKFQQGQISMENFYFRRYAKILPFFAVTTLMGVVAERSLRGLAEGLMELSLVFGLLPNNSNCFQVNGVCWTLGTIFAFYFLFPFVSALLKNKKRAWLAFAAALVIQFLCSSLFMTELFVPAGFMNKSSILYSMAFFMTGCLLYLYRNEIEKMLSGKQEHKIRYRQWILLLVCIFATVAYYMTPNSIFNIAIGDYKVTVLFVLWCMYAIGAKSFLLNNRVVKLIADNSMEIYLSHMIIFRVLQMLKVTKLFGTGVVGYLILFVILMAATLVFTLVVKFGLKWIGKFLKIKKNLVTAGECK